MNALGDTAGWPVVLDHDRLRLRPLRLRDRRTWEELRRRNARWLDRWEATSPIGTPPMLFGQYVRALRRQGRSGQALTFVVELDEEMVGQISLSGIVRGSLCSGAIGYWVSEHVAGRGVIPMAVAMLTDHALFTEGLHRVEINIRPENGPSLRVVEKLGFRPEGTRLRFLHIDGGWRDHHTFAVTVEDVPGGLVRRWTHAGGAVR